MGVKRQEVKVFWTQYLCDKCGEPMKGTGIAYMCSPPKYPHICPNGHEQILDSGYPCLTHEPIEPEQPTINAATIHTHGTLPGPVEQFLFDENGKEKGVYFDEDSKPCEMESCKGTSLTVLWADGETTHPCTEGSFIRADGHRQIIKP